MHLERRIVEEFVEKVRIAEALQYAVHVAGVTQILQPGQTASLCVRVRERERESKSVFF